eukprot:4598204-Pyramimonas_sp.AAC.1
MARYHRVWSLSMANAGIYRNIYISHVHSGRLKDAKISMYTLSHDIEQRNQGQNDVLVDVHECKCKCKCKGRLSLREYDYF